jgi:gluconate 5-dehydrogenase
LGRGQGREPIAAKRLGDEDDLKGAVPLFASDAGKHITGQVLSSMAGPRAWSPVEPARREKQ